MSKPFFCISYFEGDISLLMKYCEDNYVVYSKGKIPNELSRNIIFVPNVGYNIYSYFTYIIDNYEKLPEIILFCKNNVIGRHVSREKFESLYERKIFTPIEEPRSWLNVSFPSSVISSDEGFLEINNNWYAANYVRKYFSKFDDFYKFIFDNPITPNYLRFAPGANYLVRRENVLIRTKNFYINMRNFVSHSQYSCESHFVERSLYSIWASNLKESPNMSQIIKYEEIQKLEKKCKDSIERESPKIERIRRGIYNRIVSLCHKMVY